MQRVLLFVDGEIHSIFESSRYSKRRLKKMMVRHCDSDGAKTFKYEKIKGGEA